MQICYSNSNTDQHEPTLTFLVSWKFLLLLFLCINWVLLLKLEFLLLFENFQTTKRWWFLMQKCSSNLFDDTVMCVPVHVIFYLCFDIRTTKSTKCQISDFWCNFSAQLNLTYLAKKMAILERINLWSSRKLKSWYKLLLDQVK